jgi:hypothetical protein
MAFTEQEMADFYREQSMLKEQQRNRNITARRALLNYINALDSEELEGQGPDGDWSKEYVKEERDRAMFLLNEVFSLERIDT